MHVYLSKPVVVQGTPLLKLNSGGVGVFMGSVHGPDDHGGHGHGGGNDQTIDVGVDASQPLMHCCGLFQG